MTEPVIDACARPGLRLAGLAALSLLLAACATPGPYAEVTGERLGVADPNEATVRIVGVDGQLDPRGETTVAVAPGARLLLVQTSRHDPRRLRPQAMLPLNAKPCMRYHVVARHASTLRAEPWELVIKQVEPIAECQARFPQGGPAKG